jgi:hypothetical protein
MRKKEEVINYINSKQYKQELLKDNNLLYSYKLYDLRIIVDFIYGKYNNIGIVEIVGRSMNLKEYIQELKKIEKKDGNKIFSAGLGNPHSWRGKYEELAFEVVKDISIKDMLEQAISCVDRKFCGYKGGVFKMDLDTKIHVASLGVNEDNLLKIFWLFNSD